MKHAVLACLLALLFVMAMPVLFPPILQPLPEAPAISADKDILFTVQTENGIETANMQSYLPGVLAGEMPALFEPEALMAQSVAARTYILHRMDSPPAAHPDAAICNNAACCKAYASEAQLRKNWGEHYDRYLAKLTSAVQSTDGQYLTYGGAPIEAVFHSSSAGATEASGSIWNDRPYLISVESPETAEDVPNFITEVSLSAQELKSSLSAKHPQLIFSSDPAAWITDIRRNSSGRVQTASVCGSTLSGTQIRSGLGLRSSAFTVDYANGVFTFTVSGYGHGVGMSQYGANVFAKQGWDYAQILAHYYPDTQLTTASASSLSLPPPPSAAPSE